MIISVSRRTDIPAFYAEWFVNRIRAGYCHVPNPYNPNQVARVSLKPEDVDVIVFWTRYCRPLLRHLSELDAKGFRYYFLYTIVSYPLPVHLKSPPLQSSLQDFRRLARRIGPERVIWRYDPLWLSTRTDAEYHIKTYQQIARRLRGYTRRSVISIATIYRKVKKRLESLTRQGLGFSDIKADALKDLMEALSGIAGENEMQVTSCAQQTDWTPYGIRPGKCVDDEYIKKVFGLNVSGRKDPAQRQACGCVVSKDIGMYDTCLFGCAYCYATTRFDLARANYKRHDPDGVSLIC